MDLFIACLVVLCANYILSNLVIQFMRMPKKQLNLSEMAIIFIKELSASSQFQFGAIQSIIATL